MRRADKLKARYSVVIGEKEVATERATFKRMADGLQADAALTVSGIQTLVMQSEQ
jgi:histidyl-tRNA synthetase